MYFSVVLFAQLDPAKSLLEQGVSAEGVVQFSVQVISAQGELTFVCLSLCLSVCLLVCT